MTPDPNSETLKNIDSRLSSLEQILPGLATKAELQGAIAPLATKAELRAAIAPLASKAELRAAIAPLATRAELQAAIAPLATKAEVREEGARTRAHFDAVIERVEDRLRVIAEGHAALGQRLDDEHKERKADIRQLDVRVTRLEAGKRRK